MGGWGHTHTKNILSQWPLKFKIFKFTQPDLSLAMSVEDARLEIEHFKFKYGRAIERSNDLRAALSFERARSVKLIEALSQIGSGAYEKYIALAWAAIAEYESSASSPD